MSDIIRRLSKPKPPTTDEPAFRKWYGQWSKKTNISPDPDDKRHFYDYRAAFRAGATPTLDDDGTYHWPSRFKRPDHPNRYVDGVDTITGQPMRGDFHRAVK